MVGTACFLGVDMFEKMVLCNCEILAVSAYLKSAGLDSANRGKAIVAYSLFPIQSQTRCTLFVVLKSKACRLLSRLKTICHVSRRRYYCGGFVSRHRAKNVRSNTHDLRSTALTDISSIIEFDKKPQFIRRIQVP